MEAVRTSRTESISGNFSAETESLYRLAISKHKSGSLGEAEVLYREIVSTAPDHSSAWHFLGIILHASKQYDEALSCIENSLDLTPSKAIFLNNYGVLLRDLGRTDEAEAAFREAITLSPDYADARSNLGWILLARAEFDLAETELRKALELAPDHADATNHLRELYLSRARQEGYEEHFPEAARLFQVASSLPGGREIWQWKSLGLCPSVFPDEISIKRYWRRLDRSLNLAIETDPRIDIETILEDGFTPSFNLPHLGRCCREIKEKFHRLFSKAFARYAAEPLPTARTSSRPRIGFVVTPGHHRGFLRVHRYWLENLNADKYETVVLCPAEIVDSCRASVRRNDIQWIGLRGDFVQMAETLREARCDVLYHWKVGGGPLDYFLGMVRAAPIQCTSYGTHGTSGVSNVDYYLTSPFLEPSKVDVTPHYTERPRMFRRHIGYLSRSHVTEKVDRSEFDISATQPLYFCPHRLPKFQPSFDPLLRGILEHVPDSVIALLVRSGSPGEHCLKERLSQYLPSSHFNRLRFIPTMSPQRLMGMLAASDVVLDSPVYSGSLTAYDAFSLAIPVVTMPGPLAIQCYASGLYRRMGIENMEVPQTNGRYIELAARLGADPDFRHEVVQKIRSHSELIFEDAGCLEDFEDFIDSVL